MDPESLNSPHSEKPTSCRQPEERSKSPGHTTSRTSMSTKSALGAAVVDRIAELNKNKEITDISAIGVNGGKKADNPERCLNLRTQMFEGLKQRFFDGEISIPDGPRTHLPTRSHHLLLQLKNATPNPIQTPNPRLRKAKPRQSRRPSSSLHRTNEKTQREFKMWILSPEGIKRPPTRRRRRRYTDY